LFQASLNYKMFYISFILLCPYYDLTKPVLKIHFLSQRNYNGSSLLRAVVGNNHCLFRESYETHKYAQREHP
jgi:hypothetical protein